jgi:predicted secreted Zn-dependent protease
MSILFLNLNVRIKYQILIIFILYSLGVISQVASDLEYDREGYIVWSNTLKLSWTDFKNENKVITPSVYAITNCTIKVFEPEYTESSITYHIVNYFDKSESYVVDFAKSNNLLRHEQLHFDITELFARKFRHEISKEVYKDTDVILTFDRIFKIYNDIFDNLIEYQDKYDLETAHGLNLDVQEKWEKTVQNELKRFEKWSNPKVVLKRELPKEYLELGK